MKRETSADMRFPGERFCADYSDREACSTAHPCDFVREINRDGNEATS